MSTQKVAKMYKIPSSMLKEFSVRALKNFGNGGGKHLETLALIVGKKERDEIKATELIFPAQECHESFVDDKGKSLVKCLECFQ